MSNGWAELWADDISSTFTIATTGVFVQFPGATFVKGRSYSNDFLKVEPEDTTSMRFVCGRNGPGIWKMDYTVSFSADKAAVYHMGVFRNSSKLENLAFERKIGVGGDVGNAGGTGFLRLKSSTDIIDFRFSSDTTAAELTFEHFTVAMEMISTSTVSG